jgi:SsrA-binding protein
MNAMILVNNPSARHDFEITTTYTAGLVLSGAEVKSLRLKHASLKGSYVKLIGEEAFLINAQINPYSFANDAEYDPKKTRKLLLKRHELKQLVGAMERKHMAIVPLSFELKANHIKLNIGLGKGKKEFEKRASVKKRDLERETAKLFKEKIRLT